MDCTASRTHFDKNMAIHQARNLTLGGGQFRAYDTLDGRFNVRSAAEDRADRSGRHLRWILLAAYLRADNGGVALDVTEMLLAHRKEDLPSGPPLPANADVFIGAST
jgi:hypothetical protein